MNETNEANGTHACAMAEIKGEDGNPACRRRVPHRLLMCPMHWRMVPKDTQSALWLVYRKADAEGRAKLTKPYLLAVCQCINAVAERLKLTARAVMPV